VSNGSQAFDLVGRNGAGGGYKAEVYSSGNNWVKLFNGTGGTLATVSVTLPSATWYADRFGRLRIRPFVQEFGRRRAGDVRRQSVIGGGLPRPHRRIEHPR
jgi:hypothetical protein